MTRMTRSGNVAIGSAAAKRRGWSTEIVALNRCARYYYKQSPTTRDITPFDSDEEGSTWPR
jgi:hypothetical protein